MYKFNGFTEKANDALNLSIESAENFGHDYVGSEHILLGLLKEGSGVAATTLEEVGLDQDELEDLIPAKSKAEENDNIEVEAKVTEEIKVVKKAEKKDDDLEEGDLFNLIDSMYEKRDDE